MLQKIRRFITALCRPRVRFMDPTEERRLLRDLMDNFDPGVVKHCVNNVPREALDAIPNKRKLYVEEIEFRLTLPGLSAVDETILRELLQNTIKSGKDYTWVLFEESAPTPAAISAFKPLKQDGANN